MNGPRRKSDDELQWDAIKRAVTARVNFEMQVLRARMLNDQIADAWDTFELNVQDGELVGVDHETILEPGLTVEAELDPLTEWAEDMGAPYDQDAETLDLAPQAGDESDKDFADRLHVAIRSLLRGES